MFTTKLVPSEKKVVDTITCDNCLETIDNMSPDEIAQDGSPHGVDMLRVELIGGYGMFFDAFNHNRVPVLLCSKCAHHLLHVFPALHKALESVTG